MVQRRRGKISICLIKEKKEKKTKDSFSKGRHADFVLCLMNSFGTQRNVPQRVTRSMISTMGNELRAIRVLQCFLGGQ